MWKGKKILLMALLISFFICSIGQAGVIYWGLPPIYSSGPGNRMAGYLSNMTARASGAYAFTDYASAWGLNNLAMSNFTYGGGLGMGLNGFGYRAGLSTSGLSYGSSGYATSSLTTSYDSWPYSYTSTYTPTYGYRSPLWTDTGTDQWTNTWADFTDFSNYNFGDYSTRTAAFYSPLNAYDAYSQWWDSAPFDTSISATADEGEENAD